METTGKAFSLVREDVDTLNVYVVWNHVREVYEMHIFVRPQGGTKRRGDYMFTQEMYDSLTDDYINLLIDQLIERTDYQLV